MSMYTNDTMTQRETELMAQVAALTQERDKARADHRVDGRVADKRFYEVKNLHQQLAEAHSHMEAQRTATYQAVAREHAAKKAHAQCRVALQVLIQWAEDVTKDWSIDDDTELHADIEMIERAKQALGKDQNP